MTDKEIRAIVQTLYCAMGALEINRPGTAMGHIKNALETIRIDRANTRAMAEKRAEKARKTRTANRVEKWANWMHKATK